MSFSKGNYLKFAISMFNDIFNDLDGIFKQLGNIAQDKINDLQSHLSNWAKDREREKVKIGGITVYAHKPYEESFSALQKKFKQPVKLRLKWWHWSVASAASALFGFLIPNFNNDEKFLIALGCVTVTSVFFLLLKFAQNSQIRKYNAAVDELNLYYHSPRWKMIRALEVATQKVLVIEEQIKGIDDLLKEHQSTINKSAESKLIFEKIQKQKNLLSLKYDFFQREVQYLELKKNHLDTQQKLQKLSKEKDLAFLEAEEDMHRKGISPESFDALENLSTQMLLCDDEKKASVLVENLIIELKNE